MRRKSKSKKNVVVDKTFGDMLLALVVDEITKMGKDALDHHTTLAANYAHTTSPDQVGPPGRYG